MSTIREECPICLEYTAVIKYMVISPCCGGKACRDCYMKHLLSIPTPRCMYSADCDKVFTRTTLANMFKQTDCNKLFKYAAEQIVLREQAYIIKYHDLQELNKVKNLITHSIEAINHTLYNMVPQSDEPNIVQKFLESYTEEKQQETIKEYENALQILKKTYEEYRNVSKAFTVKYGGDTLETYDDYEKLEKRKYISIPCPAQDCTGHTNISWNCTKCHIPVCMRCGEIKKQDEDKIVHECSEENILSFDEIMNNAKCCPNCKAFIQREYGCSQMWCTNCKTAFNWTTMKIIRGGNFHNPHFTEYVDEMKRQGIYVDLHDGDNDIEGKKWHVLSEFNNDLLMQDLCKFMRRYLLLANNLETEYDQLTNEKGRLKYIDEKISLDAFKTYCRTTLTKLEKNRDLKTVYIGACSIINHLLDQYLSNEIDNKTAYSRAIDTIKYSNAQLAGLKSYRSIPGLNLDKLKFLDTYEKEPALMKDGSPVKYKEDSIKSDSDVHVLVESVIKLIL